MGRGAAGWAAGYRAALALALLAGPAAGADFDAPYRSGGPRYFPRSDGVEPAPPRAIPIGPLPVGCVPRRAPVPTNAPDDPSYAGSEYGLSQPSRYGFTPPLGSTTPSAARSGPTAAEAGARPAGKCGRPGRPTPEP